jgi:phosphatidylglycerophosphate synthase
VTPADSSGPPRPPSLADCWNARSKNCFWVAEQFGYRVGSLISWAALRLGLSPNLLTLAALACGLAGVAVACWPGTPPLIGGLALLVGLLGSCAFDCSDGVVARLSGRTSSFGHVLDKTCDLTLSLVLAGALGVVALNQPAALVPDTWKPAILVWSLVPKQVFSVVTWLRETIQHGAGHDDQPLARSRFSRAKRLVGNLTDDAPYRTGVAVSWMTGWYFEFALVMHAAFASITLLYMYINRKNFG